MTMTLPVFGATVNDIADNSLVLGQDVFELTNTSGYNFANALAASATGSNIYYKFNGHWFNLADGSVTKFSDYFNASKYIDDLAAGWTLRKWYKTGTTVSDFRPTLSNVKVGDISPVVSGTASEPVLTFKVDPNARYSTGTADLSENVSYNIKNAKYNINGTYDVSKDPNLMTTALGLMASHGNGSTSISGQTLINNSQVTITITGANGSTVYKVNFEAI